MSRNSVMLSLVRISIAEQGWFVLMLVSLLLGVLQFRDAVLFCAMEDGAKNADSEEAVNRAHVLSLSVADYFRLRKQLLDAGQEETSTNLCSDIASAFLYFLGTRYGYQYGDDVGDAMISEGIKGLCGGMDSLGRVLLEGPVRDIVLHDAWGSRCLLDKDPPLAVFVMGDSHSGLCFSDEAWQCLCSQFVAFVGNPSAFPRYRVNMPLETDFDFAVYRRFRRRYSELLAHGCFSVSTRGTTMRRLCGDEFCRRMVGSYYAWKQGNSQYSQRLQTPRIALSSGAVVHPENFALQYYRIFFRILCNWGDYCDGVPNQERSWWDRIGFVVFCRRHDP